MRLIPSILGDVSSWAQDMAAARANRAGGSPVGDRAQSDSPASTRLASRVSSLHGGAFRLAAFRVAVLAALLSGCTVSGDGGGDVSGDASGSDGVSGNDDSRPLVIVSTSILGDVVGDALGAYATVEVLIPNGADLHSAAPSARQRARMGDADLIVHVGLGLETGFEDAFEDAASNGTRVIAVGPELDPIEWGVPELADGEGADPDEGEDGSHETGSSGTHEHDVGTYDPHVWLDPARMAEVPGLVVEALVEEASAEDGQVGEADRWRESATEVERELLDLDEELQALVEGIPDEDRLLVTDHAVLGYFAERYGFVRAGSVIDSLSTSAEPSAADLADLTAELRSKGVRAVLADASGRQDLASALARELGRGTEVVEIFTEGFSEQSLEGGYSEFMRELTRSIVEGLSR